MFDARKYWLLQALTAIMFIGIYWLFLDYFGSGMGESWMNSSMQFKSQFIFIGIISILLNIYIIYYHWARPPHPKYIMLPKRRLSMACHVIGGTSEVIVGAVAWYCLYTGNSLLIDGASWAAIMVACVFILHGPSSLFQTPGVFGAKGVMVPAYIGISTLHIYCAIHVALDLNSLLWVERTWITLQAYAFVRIFGRLMWVNKIIPNSTYTVGTMAGGSTIIHFVIGPGGLVIFCLGILAHIKLFNLIMKPTENEYRAFMEERTHSATINNDVRSLWLQTNSEESFDKDDEIESARAAFNALDHDNSGTLDVSEIQDLLESWHATPHVMQAFFNRFENSKGINFDDFRMTVWSIGNVQNRVKGVMETGTPDDDDETKARKVFDFLDIDKSGFLELMEMEVLMVEWGMASHEAVAYMKEFGGEDGKISFEEFRNQMAPLWKFAYRRAFRADSAQPLN